MIILVDQLEELFSRASASGTSTEQLFEILESLARSGIVWVVATVRSDFYQECQKVDALVRMMSGMGMFPLQTPTADAVSRLITGPASLAGLKFERDGEQTLADHILRDSAGRSELLPLLEYLLQDLFENRTADGVLTFTRFRQIGGIDGALQRHCEETYFQLSRLAQSILDRVLSQLVTLGGDDLSTAVRRIVPIEKYPTGFPERELIDGLVAARILSTSSDFSGVSVVSVSHESVLRTWTRVIDWTARNREYLRLRNRVEQSEQRWREKPDESLLLAAGLPLTEASRLLAEAPHLLNQSTVEFIQQSVCYHQRRAVRRRCLQVVSAVILLTTAGITGYLYWSRVNRAEVRGEVEQLLTAEPREIPKTVEKLDQRPQIAAEFLAPYLKIQPKDLKEKQILLHARLASVGNDPSLVEPLAEELLTSKETYIQPIREILKPYAVQVTDKFKSVLQDEKADVARRFRAGIALAGLQPEASNFRDADRKLMVDQLVTSNAEFQPVLREALRPIKDQLLPDLETIFADAKASEAARLGAANAFADFTPNDISKLTELLLVANPQQFAVIYPLVSASQDTARITQLEKIAATPPSDSLGTVARVGFGQQRANAAVALLKLGERQKVLSVFDVTDDPESLYQFIFRCRERGVTPESLLETFRLVNQGGMKLDRKQNLAQYALLLSLGEYRLDEFPATTGESFIKDLGELYRNHPSSGVHGAIGWLLRKWGKPEIVKAVDETPVAYEPGREWFTLAIKVQPTSPPTEDNNKAEEIKPLPPKTFFYTFIVFPAGEFTIGSPTDEPDRAKNEVEELRHPVRLTRPFALLNREVTIEELIAFEPIYANYMQQLKAKPLDSGFAANWYDSVNFCRWLGEQMKLGEADQAYPDPEKAEGERDPQVKWAPRNWAVDLGKKGFRLPTEAEWEIAARSGFRTTYGFGSDVSLLTHFGWFLENSGKSVHPPQELRPGSRGLFDMHGNLFEWTHDWYSGFAEKLVIDPALSTGGSNRVIRGGSWLYVAASCRSAIRIRNDPSDRLEDLGFRLALSPSR